MSTPSRWRRRGAAVALAAGSSLTVAGLLAPAGGTPAATPPNLQRLLNPSGVQPIDPAEELTAQQSFGAAHFGAAGLGNPMALSNQIQAASAQAARVATSRAYGKKWTLRGPTGYYANSAARSSTSITNLGFQNLSGRVTSIATNSKRPGLVWVGTAGGGVWRSNDAGKHWKAEFAKQTVQAIGAVAIDPSNPNRVFVGTGEPNTNADAYYGNGMYVTSNAGRSWHHVTLRGVLTVFHVEAVGPSKGYKNGRVFAATNHGLWLSTDHGRHYRNVALPTNTSHKGVYTASPFGNFVTDVRVRPHHVNQVVAVVGWRLGSQKMANGKAYSQGNGFYKSTKSGAVRTWKFVPQNAVTGLGVPNNNANNTPSSDPIGRTSLAYSADGKYLWAVVQDAGNMNNEVIAGGPLPAKNSVLNGVYVSTTGDPGQNWVPKASSQTLGSAPGSGLIVQQADLYGPGVQSWYDQWIAVDPNDDNRVLLGLEEVYEGIAGQYTPTGMAEWRTVSRYWNGCALLSGVDCSTIPGPTYEGKATHPDQHAVAFVKQQSGKTRLYTGSDGGIFSQQSHTTDVGYDGYEQKSWRYLNVGLSTTQPYYAVEDSDGTIYAGLQDNGEVKIGPKSIRGDEVFGGDGFDTAVVPGDSQAVYEEYTYGAVSLSIDGGHNWNNIAPGDASSTQSLFATPFMLDPRNPAHIVEVGKIIDESTAGTNTSSSDWTSTYNLGSSVVSSKSEVSGAGVNNIATAVTVVGPRMYVPYCGVCDPVTQSNGKLSDFHVGLATNVKAGCTPQIANKVCWHKTAAKGLPNRYVQGIAMDPVHPRTVYAALSGYLRRWFPNHNRGGSLYVSTDAGRHFTNMTGNLPHTPANAIVLRNGRVFVGTDMGVFTAAQKQKHPKRTHWTRVGKGLPDASALDLRLNPSGSQLVVATHGRGVWTYNFGSKAKPAYRQHGLSTLPAPRTPTLPRPPAAPRQFDPTLLATGLALLLCAAVLPRSRRRRSAFAH